MRGSDIKSFIKAEAAAAGAVAVGFARAGRVGEGQSRAYREWIARGMNGELEYLARHAALKEHPESVLPGVRTVITLAFSYNPERLRDPSLPHISRYAYGEDYHEVIRIRLEPLVKELGSRFGGKGRICIDSAPVAERYWALQGGIGRRGLNGCVMIDGYGSYIFLAEILTDLPLEPDKPSAGSCLECGRCIAACPTGALTRAGVDATRCLSALTIEHKGEWSAEQRAIMERPGMRATLFGCDRCQEVCPHNNEALPTSIKEFGPSEEILSITAQEMASITPERLREAPFRRSPLRRAKAEGLRRNASFPAMEEEASCSGHGNGDTKERCTD